MASVAELFNHTATAYSGAVKWGERVPLRAPGVYVISTHDDPDAVEGMSSPPIVEHAVTALLQARPEATVDGAAATPSSLSDRLRAMWPAGETVVYIGLAGTSVQRRIDQFYKTALGARAPHAGGWPVKMLDPAALWVHYGPGGDASAVEKAMVARFVAGIPPEISQTLADPSAPLPFANLTFPGGRRKQHGLRGVKAAKVVRR